MCLRAGICGFQAVWKGLFHCCHIHLHANQEASCAINICHGCQSEHVPKGLAALFVIEQPDSCLRRLLNGMSDVCHSLLICVLALEKPVNNSKS